MSSFRPKEHGVGLAAAALTVCRRTAYGCSTIGGEVAVPLADKSEQEIKNLEEILLAEIRKQGGKAGRTCGFLLFPQRPGQARASPLRVLRME